MMLGGRYVIDALLHTGTTAEVWRGTDVLLDRAITVKTLLPSAAANDASIEQFLVEAQAASRVHHPGIVEIYDTVEVRGRPAIIMEYIEGRSLRDVLDSHGPVTIRDAIKIADDLCAALGALHDAHIVHCDLKPSNILIGQRKRVVLADFGSAFQTDRRAMTRQARSGTLQYAAPELLGTKPIDFRADIYSLGTMLFELVAGRRPFEERNDRASALARMNRNPPELSELVDDLPPSFTASVMRCLHRDPDERFTSVRAIAAAINEQAPVEDPSPAVDEVATPQRPQRPQPTALAPQDPEPEHRPSRPRPRPPHSQARRRQRSGLSPASLVAAAAAIALVGVVGWLTIGGGRDNVDIGVAVSAEPAEVAGLSVEPTPMPTIETEPIDPPPATEVPTPEPEPSPLAESVLISSHPVVVSVDSYDPFGDNTEHDDQLPAIVDGSELTTWGSELYRYAEFGGLKAGFGLTITLETSSMISQVGIHSPYHAWSARVYVSETLHPELEGWGSEIATIDPTAAGWQRVELSSETVGQHVLIWFTRLPTALQSANVFDGDPAYQIEVGAVEVN